MAELTFKSPGVSTREIDLSGPTAISPRGIPAGIVGTAVRGPAFVPITFATFQDFVSAFGNTDGEKFGPLAVHAWMRNAMAGTYVRVLGIGDGKARTTSGDDQGKVTNSGFVVGKELPQANGRVGANTFANEGAATNQGVLGKTYVLGCFMSGATGQVEGSVFDDAGFQPNTTYPIIRGVLMTPSGVALGLSSSYSQVVNNAAATVAHENYGAALNGGSSFGDVHVENSKQEFTMILNGHITSDSYGNILTASFDPKSPSYIANVFNTDPTKIEDAGHYLYAHWDIDPALATLTSSLDMGGLGKRQWVRNQTHSIRPTLAFCLTSSAGRNKGVASNATAIGTPNWENWEDRFNASFSPNVISQKFGGKNLNLFKLHARDDGAVASNSFKITIENVKASTNVNNKYGTFDLLVRRFNDSDVDKVVLEKHVGLDLNPSSERYIARIIGDTNTFFDFDKKAGGQKLVIEGKYPNASQFIRVQTAQDLDLGRIDASALPVGYRGIHHLVTSGSTTVGQSILGGSGSNLSEVSGSTLRKVMQLPVPMRQDLATGLAPTKTVESDLTWGYQWENKDDLDEPNKNQALNHGMYSFVRWFPNFHTNQQNPWIGDNEGVVDLSGSVRDCDRFNNNIFTLERVEVITGSNNKPNSEQWVAAKYRRDGTARGTLTDADGTVGIGSRFLNPSLDFDHLPTRKYLKYTFPLVGGYDGVNVFNEDKAKFLDAAVRREMDDASAQGGVSGPTVAALRKAVDVMETKSDVDIQILSIPGIRHESVTDYAIESTERRFDALYILDIEEKDEFNSWITSSLGANINVSNTVSAFQNRALNSSFGAAYFPDVVMTDPALGTNVQCPPTVAVMGALSLNDALAHPWFAPAGFTRGALANVIESQVKFNRPNLDELYTVDINPITSFPHTPGVVVFGQKTLLAAQSALDRVNVRRLLIDVRRKVKRVANTLLFEPNRAETLAKFSAAVTPLLTTIQQQQGLDRFKVVIDTTTTTQADVENNTVRGKIFLQPTRSVEFISLDFVVTNAGADL